MIISLHDSVWTSKGEGIPANTLIEGNLYWIVIGFKQDHSDQSRMIINVLKA